VTCLVQVELSGLTDAAAEAIDAAAAAHDVPVRAWPGRRGGMLRRARRPSVEIVDRDADPSIASETLDNPDGWPRDAVVAALLREALAFVGAMAPEGRFMFQAGWGDRDVSERIELGLADLLGLLDSAALVADTCYEVAGP
jgi:hypothetical protein